MSGFSERTNVGDDVASARSAADDAAHLLAAIRAADHPQMQRLASRLRARLEQRDGRNTPATIDALDASVHADACTVENAVFEAECDLSALTEQVESLILRCQQAAVGGRDQSHSTRGSSPSPGSSDTDQLPDLR